jgi:hypothetical protein
MTRIMFTLLTVLLFTLGSSAHAAKPKQCAHSKEKEALDTRVLQTELMVAALGCGERAYYNKFVSKYKADFKERGANLHRYFSRVYKNKAQYQLNKFITTLANDISRDSKHPSITLFCQKATVIFRDALETTSTKSLTELVSDKRFESVHGIQSCAATKSKI